MSSPSMGKDFDYRHAAYNGGLGAVPMEPVLESQPNNGPSPASYRSPVQTPAAAASTPSPGANPDMGGDEALMDLAQLEDLHNEAERMKGLGNKHMAAQVRSNTLFRIDNFAAINAIQQVPNQENSQ